MKIAIAGIGFLGLSSSPSLSYDCYCISKSAKQLQANGVGMPQLDSRL